MAKLSSKNSKNKNFIINNQQLLSQYVKEKQNSVGLGIVVVNLLLLATADVDESNLLSGDLENWQEATIHQPISYIPEGNFWFKTIGMKVRRKHKIDIQAESNADKTFVVFIKDAAVENFSIYTIKNSKQAKNLNR